MPRKRKEQFDIAALDAEAREADAQVEEAEEETTEVVLTLAEQVNAAGVYTVKERPTQDGSVVYDVYKRGTLVLVGAILESLVDFL